MKNMKRILATLALVLAAASAGAQTGRYDQGVGGAIGAVSTDVGMIVKYVGVTPAAGNITVAAGGDISLFTGAAGSGTVDTTTECPVSGALGGIIDVSDAACNTMGEVCDAINSSPNWTCALVDSLRSDNSDNTLITLANTSASLGKGIGLLKDTTIALNVSIALHEGKDDIKTYTNERSTPPMQLNPNPFADTQPFFMFARGTFTGTGADVFEVLSVKQNNQGCPTATASTAASIICSNTETVTTLFQIPGGGTTVATVYDQFKGYALPGRKGEKMLVRLRAATTFTAAALSATGFVRPAKSPLE